MDDSRVRFAAWQVLTRPVASKVREGDRPGHRRRGVEGSSCHYRRSPELRCSTRLFLSDFLGSRAVDALCRDLFLAQDGDHDAFTRFVRATADDVRRFCSWFTRPGGDLDDLVQETYLRAYRGMHGYRADSSARSWLLTISRRVCLDHAEKGSRERRRLGALRPFVRTSADVGSASDLELLVARLPEHQRDAFVLVRLLGYCYDEAAEVLGCPRGTVQSRVARARLQLSSMVSNALPVETQTA